MGSAELPLAAVYMRPHQEGSVIQGKVVGKSCVGLCAGVMVLSPPETVGPEDCLLLVVRASLCVGQELRKGVC